MNYGYYQRTKPLMVVRKGWNPLEPVSPGQTSAPVKDGELIMSGMAIVLEYVSANARNEWVIMDGGDADHLKQIPHFALQDYTTKDVVASGLLTGFSCAGQFELQTGYWADTGTPPLDAGCPLTIGTTTDVGHVITCARGDGPTKPIVGYLTEDHAAGPVDLDGVDSSATDLEVVRFNTAYDPRNAAS